MSYLSQMLGAEPKYKYKTFRDIPREEWANIKSEEDLAKLVEPGGMPATKDDLPSKWWTVLYGVGTVSAAFALLLLIEKLAEKTDQK